MTKTEINKMITEARNELRSVRSNLEVGNTLEASAAAERAQHLSFDIKAAIRGQR